MALQRATAGHGQFVELVGEPGSGKSFLLADITAHASSMGYRVCRARAQPETAGRSLGLILDALAQAGMRREDGRAPAGPALREALLRQADERPLMLALDDLQWADELTLDSLAHLAGDPPKAPLITVVAYRPRQILPMFPAALATPAVPAERHVLGPVDLDDVRTLFSAGVSRARCTELLRLSAGMPLYLRALAEHSQLRSTVGHFDFAMNLSALTRASMAQDFFAASAPAQRIARVAAVAGDTFDAGLVSELSEIDEVHVVGGLDELLAADVLRHSSDPASFRYRHPLVRHAVYDTIDVSDRMFIHRRAAAILEKRGAPAEIRAAHIENFAGFGDDDLADILVGGALARLAYTPNISARWLKLAMRLSSRQGDLTHRVRLLLATSAAEARAGEMTAGHAHALEALGLLPEECSDLRAETVRRCALTSRARGRHAEADELVVQELRKYPPRDRGLPVAELRLQHAVARLFRPWPDTAALPRPTVADDHLDEIITTAHDLADQRLLAMAHAFRGILRAGTLPPDQVISHVTEASRILDGLSDHELTEDLGIASWLSWIELQLECYSTAGRHAERAARLARRTGQLGALSHLLTTRALVVSRLGQVDEAIDTLDEALETARQTTSDHLRGLVLTEYCGMALSTGDAALARRLGGEAVRSVAGVSDWLVAPLPARLACAHFRIDHNPIHYVNAMSKAAGDAALTALPPLLRGEFYESVVEAALAAGDVEAARQCAEDAHAEGRRLGLPGRQGFGLLARAQVIRAGGRSDDTISMTEAAAISFERAGDRLNAARAHLITARDMLRSGLHKDAAGRTRRAEVLLDPTTVKLLDRQLSAIDGRAPFDPPDALADGGPALTPARTSLVQLTERERQIAGFVVQGRTNRQIARRLHLSEKTIEGHLTRIFAKLSVPSRTALASMLARGAAR